MSKRIRILLLGLVFFISTSVGAQHSVHNFSLGDSTFILDGKPFQMISGEMHYTRVPREA